MCTSLIGGFCQACVAVLLPFPLWSRAVQEGWLVGWLHRKGNGLYQTADGGQHVLAVQKHTQACNPSVAFIKSDPDCRSEMSAVENLKFSVKIEDTCFE